MSTPEYLTSPESPISSWVTEFTSEHQLAGLGLQQRPVLRLGWVPCTWPRPVVVSGLCLSPSALSLLGQRQQLSAAVGCFCPASKFQRSPMNML